MNLSPVRVDRFLQKFQPVENGCWEWTGRLSKDRYGRIGMDEAHRFAYELFVGPIPAGLDVDHLCRVRHCVNPDHLDPVTHAENMRRTGRPACGRGHAMQGDNIAYDTRGHRYCVACRSFFNERRKERRRADRWRESA